MAFSKLKILTNPRGYRELRSASEMRKLLNRKIVEQGGKCAICQKEFIEYSEIVADHKQPKGMGELGETTILTISEQSIDQSRHGRSRSRRASVRAEHEMIPAVSNNLRRNRS